MDIKTLNEKYRATIENYRKSIEKSQDLLNLAIQTIEVLTSSPTAVPQAAALKTEVPQAEVPQETNVPLSDAQERLWFLSQLDPTSSSYNVGCAIQYDGQLNPNDLEKACQHVTQRQEILSMIFKKEDAFPVGILVPNAKINIEQWDISSTTEEEKSQKVEGIVESLVVQPFDLSKSPLIHFHLIKLSQDRYVFIILTHHIILDGQSIKILMDDIAKYYNNHPQKPLTYQFKDYVLWKRDKTNKVSKKAQQSYWVKELLGVPETIALPYDHLPDISKSPSIKSFQFSFDREFTKSITEMRRLNMTSFTIILTAFQVFLYRLSQQNDFVVGIISGGRDNSLYDAVIGFFINILPFRTKIDENLSFVEMLKKNNQVLREAYQHQDFSLPELISELKIVRSANQEPLFNVLFNYLNFQMTAPDLEGVKSRLLWHEEGRLPYALSVLIHSYLDSWQIKVNYDANLFKQETIQKMFTETFPIVLKVLFSNSEKPLKHLSFLSEKEKQTVQEDWNKTQKNYDYTKSLSQLFEDRVDKTPQSPAIVFDNRSYTFKELNDKANQLAGYLKILSVQTGSIVGLSFERNLDLIVCMLGILKAGLAYLPLDPHYPQGRLEYMIESSGIDFLLTQESVLQNLPWLTDLKMNVIVWETIQDEMDLLDSVNPAYKSEKDQVAYLIYTSGSTGKPKGVLGTHQGMVNRLMSLWELYPYEKHERLCQKTSINFVDHIAEIFSPLLQSIPLYILSNTAVKGDARDLIHELNENKITRIVLVPSLLRVLLILEDPLNHLRYVFSSGEALPMKLAMQFFERLPNCKLVNLYGSSEVSADVTYYEIKPSDVDNIKRSYALIGKPIANNQIYILDTWQRIVPVGVPGELWASGVGLSLGYVNRPNLTAERFLPHPFISKPGLKIYRTGDLCRWLEDGQIEYLGRVDHQVKIRGFRVELGEIESVLLSHPDVKEAVVTAKEDASGEKQLVAYYVLKVNGNDIEDSLRKSLKNRLPDYMIPSAFVLMDSFPLNPNKKIDLKALPPPQYAIKKDSREPKNDLERKLMHIWCGVLKREKVGVTENFFEIGGNSLLGMQLLHMIHKQLNVSLPLTSLFKSQTIESMAVHLHDKVSIQEESSLVTIQAKGNLTPVFAIHPVGGTVFCYLPLSAQFGKEQPFYAFQQVSAGESIKKMASRYLKEIKTIQPEGPYYLLGWSMGGVIAMEMAHQLEQEKEKINRVILIDSYVPNLTIDFNSLNELQSLILFIKDWASSLGKTIEVSPAELSTFPTLQDRLDYLVAKCKNAGIIQVDEKIIDLERAYGIYNTNLESLQNHHVEKIFSPVLAFSASHLAEWSKKVNHQNPLIPTGEAWSAFTTHPLSVTRIEADHYTIMSPPAVEKIARVLLQENKP